MKPNEETPTGVGPDQVKKTERNEYDRDFLCGMFSWRPRCLQPFAKPIYFSLFFLLFGIFQGSLKIGLGSSMTTIERKFSMSGSMISIIMIMDNISGTIASLILGYYALKISQIRLIVFGVWVSVASCTLFVLPYFLYGNIDFSGKVRTTSLKDKTTQFTEFCQTSNTSHFNETLTTAPFDENDTLTYNRESVAISVLVLLSIANFLSGLGGTTFYVVGTTYTDDIVKKKNTAIYFGSILALRAMGPLVGVVVSSYFLSLHEHLSAGPIGITTRDPRWIGAWWPPFILWGCLSFVVSIPLVFFPRYMRKSIADSQKQRTVNKGDETSVSKKISADLKDFWEVTKRLSKNRLFFWKILGVILYVNGMGGQIMNMPKFIEIQYRVSAGKASFLTGTTKILAVALSTFTGGLLVHIFKPSAFFISWCGLITDFIHVLVLIIAIFLPCDNWRLGGTSLAADGALLLTTSCNGPCDCSTAFQPFCDLSSNKSYFNPCYGGCLGTNLTSMACNCLDDPSLTIGADSLWEQSARFVSGYCRNDCSNLSVFITITAVAQFISTLNRVGSTLIGFRCIDQADKALAIGIGSFAINLFASIPYPLIYGTIFDSTCLIWGDQAKNKGNCWYYDSDVLRYRFMGTTLFFYILAMLCDTMKTYYAYSLKNLYGEADEQHQDKEKNDQKDLECEEMIPKTRQ